MSSTRLITPRDFKSRRPDVELIREIADKLEELELADHLSDSPRFRGLKYIGIGAQGRDELVAILRECANWIDRPSDVPLMIGGSVMKR